MRITSETVAVITGAASGIGFGLAEALAERGAKVVLTDVRAEGLAAAARTLRESGADVREVVTDVTDLDAVRALAHQTIAAFGHVDLVCNNAGVVSPAAPMWAQTAATWRRMFDIKVFGVLHGVQAFVPLLIEQGHGHVLNTASSGGLAPLPDRTPYTGTMHAVVGLTETLHVELQRISPDLGATVLCPGLVDTPLGANSVALGAIELPKNVTGASMRSTASGGGILSARAVAEAALDAVQAGRVHCAPGDGVWDRAKARVDALLANISHDVVPPPRADQMSLSPWGGHV